MISIVIPLFNKELSIQNTIHSVLQQTYPHFELIIVNDGSTDNSLNVVKSINDGRIRIIEKLNGGVSSARNRGIQEAKFDWISFLDADDLWKNNHLEVICKMIKDFPNDWAFATGFIRNTDESIAPEKEMVDIIDDYFSEIQKTQFVCSSANCFRKAVFQNVGYFLEGFSRGEDTEMWQRIGREYRFIRSNKITAIYRMDSENKLTKSSFDFSKSTISTVHKRFRHYVSTSEKEYYIKSTKSLLMIFLKRLDLKSLALTFYRLICLQLKKVEHEKTDKK